MLVSVIIITLNEADNIESTIMAVKNAAVLSSGKSISLELIVSDGGSNDGTTNIAKNLVDKIIIGNKGRYKQLNAGAEGSKGDVLLFLHADTLLPKGAILRVCSILKDSKIIGGGFKKCWNWNPELKRTSFLTFISFLWQTLDNWIVNILKNIPGDNAIFVRKSFFKELNGFSTMWICEDLDIMRRMKRYGKKRIIYIPSAVITSTRRFEKYGFFRTVFVWFLIGLFWKLGMPQIKIKKRFKKYSTVPKRGNKTNLRF